MDKEKLAKLQAQAASLRLGGKGTPRRKQVKKSASAIQGDDRKVQAALKKLGVQPVSGVEEVNMFKEDGNVLHFTRPAVHAATPSNTLAVYGHGQNKELTDLVPGILNQLGPDSLAQLRRLAEQYQAAMAKNAAANKEQGEGEKEADEEDIPDLVENFDEADESEKKEDAAANKLEELN